MIVSRDVAADDNCGPHKSEFGFLNASGMHLFPNSANIYQYLLRRVIIHLLGVTGFPGALDGCLVLPQVDEGCSKTGPVGDASEE